MWGGGGVDRKKNEIQKEKEIMHGNIEMLDYYGVVRNFANEPNLSSERWLKPQGSVHFVSLGSVDVGPVYLRPIPK